MAYYDLSKQRRKNVYSEMEKNIHEDFSKNKTHNIIKYASDQDTYIRKNCYLIIGRLYKSNGKIREQILTVLETLSGSENEKIRQTVVYALGEIGKTDFHAIEELLNAFLHEKHHSVKNGLTGALKQMGEKNPVPVILWVKNNINNCSVDMKPRILHGLELRGRTHPEDLLPLLRKIVHSGTDKKTEKMIIHIIGQISYKKGCLEKVASALSLWENKEFVSLCKKEILKVHWAYKKFSVYEIKATEKYLEENL